MSKSIARRVYENLVLLGARWGASAHGTLWDPADFSDLDRSQVSELHAAIVATLLGDMLVMGDREMGCGHTMADLIGGSGAITQCGACLAERSAAGRATEMQVAHEELRQALREAGKMQSGFLSEVAAKAVRALVAERDAAVAALAESQAHAGPRGRDVMVTAGGGRSLQLAILEEDDEQRPIALRILVYGPPSLIVALIEQARDSMIEADKAKLIDAHPEREATLAPRGVYIASKTKHAAKWKTLRAAGLPVISSWIDVSADAETTDDNYHELWGRNITEASSVVVLLAYHEPGEIPKGALVEIGAALAGGAQVYWVGPSEGQTIVDHERVCEVSTLEEALELVGAEVLSTWPPTLDPTPDKVCCSKCWAGPGLGCEERGNCECHISDGHRVP